MTGRFQTPKRAASEGKQGDGYGEGSFLGAGAFEELERDEPGGEEAEEYAGNEDVEDEEVGGDQGNHARPPLRS
jgi:hypothetical protein